MENMVRSKISSLKGKTALVTGAAGFIGSHLVRRLLKKEVETRVLLRKDTDCFRLNSIIRDIGVWNADLADYPSICRCVKEIRPQFLFHLAAFRNVKRDLELLNLAIDINIKGTANLLRAFVNEKIALECFVNTGTCEEYGDGTVPFLEDHREMPVSPYSASKVAATYLCQMVFKTTGLPIVTLRPFLTYGPYQSMDMFIPSLIHHCLTGKDFPMTRGDQTREFNYVDDIVEAYLMAATSQNVIGQIINVGNSIEYRIKDVAEKIVREMGCPIRLLMGALPKRPGETLRFFCNNEKAKRLLGWSPRISLDEGLKKTIEWYKNYITNNPGSLT